MPRSSILVTACYDGAQKPVFRQLVSIDTSVSFPFQTVHDALCALYAGKLVITFELR